MSYCCCISSVSYIKPQLILALNVDLLCCISSVSYIKPQPLKINSIPPFSCISSVSYIKPQLQSSSIYSKSSCISSVSYIKPQLMLLKVMLFHVVYRPFPTSNHNLTIMCYFFCLLYIVRFLHQTTTIHCLNAELSSCISSVSYIKPQPLCFVSGIRQVVYRPFPTSNHNYDACQYNQLTVVYRPFPTSNHNL